MLRGYLMELDIYHLSATSPLPQLFIFSVLLSFYCLGRNYSEWELGRKLRAAGDVAFKAASDFHCHQAQSWEEAACRNLMLPFSNPPNLANPGSQWSIALALAHSPLALIPGSLSFILGLLARSKETSRTCMEDSMWF